MTAEFSKVSRARSKDLEPGDAVALHFASNMTAELIGTVLAVKSDRLRLLAHKARPASEVEQQACLDWDIVIPWSAIGFVRHLATGPGACKCTEALT